MCPPGRNTMNFPSTFGEFAMPIATKRQRHVPAHPPVLPYAYAEPPAFRLTAGMGRGKIRPFHFGGVGDVFTDWRRYGRANQVDCGNF